MGRDEPQRAPVVLRARGLTKVYRMGEVEVRALRGIDLDLFEGEFVVLLGPSGSGKSTLLNILGGLDVPTDGEVHWRDHDLRHAGERELTRYRRDHVGFVFQLYNLLPSLTARENVRVALQRRLGTSFHFWRSDRTLAVLDPRADELLDQVGLLDQRDTLTVELPYGRKRALELATTLALDPEVLLLDEPTQGMGHEDVGRVVALIRRVAEGRTVLMVEHNLSVVQDLAHKVTVLARGSVLAEGSYAEVSRNPAVLEAYIGGTA